jgi:uncharacterized membrane protein YcaP (DUF421 family)
MPACGGSHIGMSGKDPRQTMNQLTVDWGALFRPDDPLLETIVRGSLLYVATFAILRVSLRRSSGQLSMLDFVFVLLVANAAANSMTGDHLSITNGIVLVMTVVAWEYGLNLLSYHSRFVERLIMPPSLLIIKDGKPLRRTMRREFLSMNELMVQLREQGLERLEDVRRAYIEGDGSISIIPYNPDDERPQIDASMAKRIVR